MKTWVRKTLSVGVLAAELQEHVLERRAANTESDQLDPALDGLSIFQ